MIKVRLQKILSQAGLGSRREIEGWISQGLITVNGKLATLGEQAGPLDKIAVRGKLIANPLKEQNTIKTRALIYHKPIGEISSRHDPNHTRTIFDNLPELKQGR